MYLKALEIHGFKSFPDRTRLNFTGGLTAVVGPNGSGKSNISDAVRWVLGEQSTKTLRGVRMEDVIFGGTQTRKAMGYAQVTLYIENTDRGLPIERDEITVSRKLYRTGESEYRINDQNVRLKDVNELFMDTGLGRDGYSIIGQGKIAEIVGARSGDRREIFEEAAGISKFRYRKTEAERKLTAAQENLLRLKDILSELEERVGPLKVQAEKASRYVELAGRKRSLELSLWVSQLERLRGLLREQEDRVASAQGAHTQAEEDLARVERTAEEAFARMSQCTLEIDRLRTSIREREEQAAQAQSQAAVLENDIFHNEESIRRITGEMEAQDEAGRNLAEQLAGRADALEELEQRIREVQDALEEQIAQCSAAAEEEGRAAGQVEAKRQALSALAVRLSEAKVASITAQSAGTELQNRLAVLRESQAAKEQRRLDLEREQKDCAELLESIEETLQGLANSRSGVQMKLDKRLARRQELEQELRSAESRSNEKLQKARLLEGLEQNMEGFAGSVKFVLREAARGSLHGVHSAVSKLIQVEEAYSIAVEIALGGALQHIVVEDDDAAKRAIQRLKESKAGRATFLPVSTIRGSRLKENGLESQAGFVSVAADLVGCKPAYRAIVESLLGRVAVAEDLNSAVRIARAYGNRFRVVTLDGQVVNAGGSLTGGSVARNAGLLSRQPEIDKLKRESEEILRGAQECQTKLKALGEELSALNAQLLAMDSEAKTASEDKIRYQGEAKRIAMSLEDLSRDQKDSSGQMELLKSKRQELLAEAQSSVQRVEKLSEEQSDLEEALREADAQRAARRERLEAQNAERSRLEMEALSLRKDREGAQRALEELRERHSGQDRQMERYREEIAALERNNRELSGRIQEQKQAALQGTAEAEKARSEIALLQEKRQQYEQQTAQLRAQEREMTAHREQASRELARIEERKTSLQSEYDGFIARMWDEYEVTRSEAEAEAAPIEDVPAAQRRLGEVKAQIKALGTVNLEALEEYEQVSQRYRFLKEQIEDVEQSKEQLGRIIRDLTVQMRRMFSDSFQAINRHFGEIFAELFDGGKASLSLTDESDVLESGIEINVQPPGKLIKNLAALSGGEQAFVAIAIYFAILRVRPAPFCLLDEIEAALDDVNVAKFAQYLRRLGDKTQFVAITHRRGTMEEADVLYGVTMQEEGVSKLLELSVSELESKIQFSESDHE